MKTVSTHDVRHRRTRVREDPFSPEAKVSVISPGGIRMRNNVDAVLDRLRSP
jgi:hypothetical protein